MVEVQALIRVVDLFLPRGNLSFHEAIIETLGDAIKFLHEVVFDGKADSCLTTLYTELQPLQKMV